MADTIEEKKNDTSVTPAVETSANVNANPAPAPEVAVQDIPKVETPAAPETQVAPQQAPQPEVKQEDITPAAPAPEPPKTDVAAPAEPQDIVPQDIVQPQGERATPYGARATAYGNSASNNSATAVTTLGNIDNSSDYGYTNTNTKDQGLTPKKIASAIILIIFFVWAFFLYSDYESAKNGDKPKYCFFGETIEEYDIGTITTNRGLGYKVVKYSTDDTSLLEFSALWQKNKKLEDIRKE